MTIIRRTLITYTLLLLFSLNAQSQYLEHQGQPYYISGANIAWNQFGWDFGQHPVWGVGYDSTWFENAFSELQTFGANTARIWIHCDGRGNPEFTPDGHVSGLDTNFFSHLDDLIQRAENHNLLLILCLWSFDLTKDYRDIAGPFAGLHADLITDSLKTQSYIDNALIPIIQRYQNACNILAWEVINEPEWSCQLPRAGHTQQTVPIQDMQRFVGMCAIAIHQHTDIPVTIGSTSFKWHSPTDNRMYWDDQQLCYQTGNHPLAYLDFYSVHYYDWMSDKYTPYVHHASHWQLNKPILLTEVPSEAPNSLEFSVEEQIQTAFQNEYSGLLFWSYKGGDGAGEWQYFQNQLLEFKNTHPHLIELSHDCSQTPFSSPTFESIPSNFILPSPLPINSPIQLTYDSPCQASPLLEIFTTNGQRVFETRLNVQNGSNSWEFSNLSLPRGLYFIQLQTHPTPTTRKLLIY